MTLKDHSHNLQETANHNNGQSETKHRFISPFLISVMIFLAIFFFITRFTELEHIANLLSSIYWGYLWLALAAEAIWLISSTLIYKRLFNIVGIQEGVRHTLLLMTSANFANIITPSSGMAGLAIFWTDARRRGYSRAHATIVCMLYLLIEYISLLYTIILGLIVLFRRNILDWTVISASILFAFLTCLLALLLYLGVRFPALFTRVLTWVAERLNSLMKKLLKREYIPVERVGTFADSASEAISVLRAQWRRLLLPLGLGFVNKFVLIGILTLMFIAFQVPFSIGTLVGGFSLSYLFVYISPTPAGIGIVEGVMALALKSLGVSLEAATVLTLAFRAFSFWLPLMIGFISFRLLMMEQNKEKTTGLVNPSTVEQNKE